MNSIVYRVAQIHIADLRSKYQAYALDIVEMRSLWFVFRNVDWSRSDPVSAGAKEEWALAFKGKLDELTYREAKGTLADADARNIVYSVKINIYC